MPEKKNRRGGVPLPLREKAEYRVPKYENVLATPETIRLTEGLASFRFRWKLSLRELCVACGGENVLSHSAAGRITQGANTMRFIQKRMNAIQDGLTGFLRNVKGLADREIETELKQIFGEEFSMSINKVTLSLDAQVFFGLKRDPFALESNPRCQAEAFTSPHLDALAARIEDAITYQGFVAFVGDVGSGKSMLIKRMCEMAETNTRMKLFRPEFIEQRLLSSSDIIFSMLEMLELPPKRSRAAAQRQLTQHLAAMHEADQLPAILLDNAHDLHDRALKSLQNLFELSSTGGFQRYLGVVLFGWEKLEKILVPHRQLQSRLEIIHMPPLGKNAAAYLEHRIKRAGGSLDALFEKKAVEKLAARAATPLEIGNLANEALMQSFKADEEKVLAKNVKGRMEDPEQRAVA